MYSLKSLIKQLWSDCSEQVAVFSVFKKIACQGLCLIYVSFFPFSVIVVVMETWGLKVMGPWSLSLLFPWGDRDGLTRQTKDTFMDQKKKLFLFLLHDILHFYLIIIINVNSYCSGLISFLNIMSFYHHDHPMGAGVISQFVDKKTGW